jgi:transposase
VIDLSNAKGETIGHLGLIASVMKDVGLMEKIDEQLGKVEGGLNYGIRVGGMILNRLGFINTVLYLTPRFFHDKPVDLLLGEGGKAEQLNDDSLGRGLDKIGSYGPTKWYKVMQKLNENELSSTYTLCTRRSFYYLETMQEKSIYCRIV